MRWLSRLLGLLRRHQGWGWAGLILYACAVTFPHQPVQNFVQVLVDKFTRMRVYQGSAAIAFIEGAVLTWLFFRSLSRRSERLWLAAFWLVSFALMFGTWLVFNANNTELVHYPQYFPEGMALLALTLSPVESMAWLALFGGLDETYQYIYLVAGKAVPLDFNDIYMDLVGGAAGIIFAMALLRCERRSSEEPWRDSWKRILSRPGVLAIFGTILTGFALWVSGKMLLYDAPGAPPHWFTLSRLKTTSFWYFSPDMLGPHHFHELTSVEGMIVILATIGLFVPLDRKLKISTK